MIRTSVIIPTFRRNDGFLRAGISVFSQDRLDGVELVAVDNSPEGAALDLFKQLATYAPIPFRWTHEPRAGVSHARNAGLLIARGAYVAWLDDDQEAPAHWLKAMTRILHATDADCVFGPVRAHAPEDAPHRLMIERLYTRAGPKRSGRLRKTFGVGNSLHRRESMLDAVAPFDPAANETGGEDDRLFARAKTKQLVFAWAAEGGVDERIDSARLTLAHGLKRAFAYGQGPSATAWREGHGARLIRHMLTGIVQFSIFSLALIAVAPLRNATTDAMLERCARALGKIVWFKPQRFYGAALDAKHKPLKPRYADATPEPSPAR